jgi:hypothetical protein
MTMTIHKGHDSAHHGHIFEAGGGAAAGGER